jgi:signal transduction histidine kinase
MSSDPTTTIVPSTSCASRGSVTGVVTPWMVRSPVASTVTGAPVLTASPRSIGSVSVNVAAGNPRPVDVTRLVADAARDAAAIDPQRPIATDVDGPVIVSGDEDRLRQVIANIVGNALVHTPASSPIELRVGTDGPSATISVTDRGHGMTPEVAARVTQRFYRSDPARARDRGGSGLGLSIADATVSAHGGTIAVDSELGRGTTVTVTLPLG